MGEPLFTFLFLAIKKANPKSHFAELVGKNLKGKLSQLFYALGIGLAFVNPWISYTFFIIISITWFIPDKKYALES